MERQKSEVTAGEAWLCRSSLLLGLQAEHQRLHKSSSQGTHLSKRAILGEEKMNKCILDLSFICEEAFKWSLLTTSIYIFFTDSN